jgi:hypothetical protein
MPETEQAKHWTCLECGKVHPLQVSACECYVRPKAKPPEVVLSGMSGMQEDDWAICLALIVFSAGVVLNRSPSLALVSLASLPGLLGCSWGIWSANRRGLLGRPRWKCIAARVFGLWLALFGFALLPSMMSSCIAEGTLVDTPSGLRRIETLVPGDEVWTRGPRGESEIGKVAATQHHTVFRCLEFKFSDRSTLAITGEHPVMTDSGWKRADSLSIGDDVQTRNGKAQVNNISKMNGVLRVYDLTIDGNANFIAGGVVVHNKTRAYGSVASSACKAFAEAQEVYHRTDWDGDGVMEYAQALSGDFSLLERKFGTGDLALIDRAFSNAEGDPRNATPKAGYCFRVLTVQGSHAKGGVKSYIDDKGNMTGGYGLVAFPARYGHRGARDTFIISKDGTVFQADLGENSVERALQMKAFDPDPAIWQATD